MKIQVIGASGTGKSTLCHYISEKTGIYWIDTDKYLWKDSSFIENHPVSKRFEMYEADVSNHSDYVVSGSVYSWNPSGFVDRDVLVLLLVDERTRMQRIYKREISRFGTRMFPGGDHYQDTCEFLDWCSTYFTADSDSVNSFSSHVLRLKEASCKTMVLNGNKPLEELYSCILRMYKNKP